MGQAWPKDLFFYSNHLGGEAREDCGWEEKPFSAMSFAAKMARGALSLSYVDIIHDPP